ncbi:uncharacterized protein LOC123896099 [Trifolium pratense]|uniref:uncharacterized protein LOC123896099 n=1 Tax=Trifolium pratense TaxID=57577 RepID=UPI001E69137B|nr:uncharacterized protein LOC123896099 [Trifolium pratense]
MHSRVCYKFLSPQRKSFAQALQNVCDVPVGNFPKPCLKGKRLSIKIPEDSYKAGLDRCKNNLHGRLIMAKGDKPLRLHEIREKLTKAWAPVNKWQITPLGKGFYEFYFQNCEDLNRVWSIGTWNLKPGLLRLSAWSSDFKPENLKVTNAQIWIRIYGLPQEYWMPTTLFSIASGIGTPLSLDEATKQRTMGHFARILVDVNLAEELHYQILVEREGYAFFVDIDYENLPYFCEHCCCIGHSIDKCRNVNNKAKDQKKNVFGDVNTKVSNAVAKVDSIQQIINDSGYTDALGDEEKLAQVSLNDALRVQEYFWRDKSRSKWFVEGDRNTGYFHKLTKIRHISNRMIRLKAGDNYIEDINDIEHHVLNFYKELFASNNNCAPTDIIERTIPHLITVADNDMMTKIPSFEEVKQAVFNMDGSSSPGPNGFGGCFFQNYWDIVGSDVVASVTQFFSHGWILPNLNSSHVALVPKFPGADTIENFRPIAVANFQFKIITKILADRLAVIAPKIVSEHQRGFVQGRHIYECICIASEAINMLDKKSFGGNMAMKIDIKKVFDTLDWSFLLKVLQAFGFNHKFCSWISTILHSAKLSLLVNGKTVGFFGCSRGVRQGDPLSPLLFCIAEEVLSRHLSLLVDDNKLSCITSEYGANSGQRVSPHKSKLYGGSISPTRLNTLSNTLGFSLGSLPFDYLGVPIFKGKPKNIHLQALADRVKSKLASWKGHSLSMMGRVQLVNFVIHGMLTYSFKVYSWPKGLIKQMDRCIRNFIWSGSVDKKKLVTLSWDKVCTPTSAGGLGLRKLKDMNKAGCLKLCWDLIKSDKQCAITLKSRFFRNSSPINHAISSSIWSSLKNVLHLVRDHSIWQIGNSLSTSFWNDNWLGYKLKDLILEPLPNPISHLVNAKVAEVVHNQVWALPEIFKQQFPIITCNIHALSLPSIPEPDELIWEDSISGELTFKLAYSCDMQPPQCIGWTKFIWKLFIPPSRSLVAWRIMHNVIATDDNLIKRGLTIVSCCSLCGSSYETVTHLFLRCPFIMQYWNWLSSLLGMPLDLSNFDSLLGICNKGWSPQLHDLIIAAIVNILWKVWKCRNNVRFNDIYPYFSRDMIYVKSLIHQTAHYSKGHMYSSIKEFSILKHFGVDCHPPPPPSNKQVNWIMPPSFWVKCNTDGASRGSPGISSCGGIFRDHLGTFLGAFSANIGVATSLYAEICAAIYAIEFASAKGWTRLWLESDPLSSSFH